MKKKKRNNPLKQTKDYYPIINPDRITGPARISEPSEDDKENAKRWVDDTEK